MIVNFTRKYGLLIVQIAIIVAIGTGVWAYYHQRGIAKQKESDVEYAACNVKAGGKLVGAMRVWCSIEDGSDDETCRNLTLETAIDFGNFFRARDGYGTVNDLINAYDADIRVCDFARSI